MTNSKVFSSSDTDLYTVWRMENSGIVALVVPEFGEVKMSLAKAEDIGHRLLGQAQLGRRAAERLGREPSQ